MHSLGKSGLACSTQSHGWGGGRAAHREGWYQGLSEAFLGVRAPKVLLLAGTDRLDRALTIGQMQGRFQMVLLPQARPRASTMHAQNHGPCRVPLLVEPVLREPCCGRKASIVGVAHYIMDCVAVPGARDN